ncbi:MAG: hypothetical protein NC191_05595 [Muribaculaceae bacterium]|nr:hypothetical protein [Muribaculaceae bacterium]
MINSVQKFEPNKNPFGQVSTRTAPSDYWHEQQPKQIENSDKYLAANFEKIRIITPEEARKTNNIKIIGLSIAGATVLTAAGIFFVLKGGPKGLSRSFINLKDFLERKVQKAKLDSDGVLSTTNKVYVYAYDKLNKLQRRFDVINNYNTVKDLSFKKLMGCNKYLAKLHDKITKLFERVGRQAVLNTYSKTDGLLHTADRFATQRPGMSASSPLTDRARQLSEEISQYSEQHFGNMALRSRYHFFKSAVEALKDSFTKMKVFLSKGIYSEFMADSKIVKQREDVINSLRQNRREILYPISHLVKDSDDSILKMVGSLGFKDTERITQLRKIRSQIKKFAKAASPEARAQVQANIVKLMDEFSNSVAQGVKAKTITDEAGSLLNTAMAKLKNNLVNYNPGKLQELLSLYKEILPKSEYAQVEKLYKAWIKSLDKSIKLETEDYFGKLRDLAMGSAPTDILTIVGSFGILGYNLIKSKDNDQRTSIALKYGIPALAGIGSSLYFNAKLFAGSKALICSSLLSFGVNRLGAWADGMLKKYKQSKSQNPPKTV